MSSAAHLPRALSLAACLVAAALAGCVAAGPINPAAPLSRAQARRELAALRAHPSPTPPPRPLLVLGGYRTPGYEARRAARALAAAANIPHDRVLALGFVWDGTIDRAVRQTVEAVEAAWPDDDPHATIEVDVVGISMGGLVARWAALPPDQRLRGDRLAPLDDVPRLRVARLFTLASPHRGSNLSAKVQFDGATRDMTPGSLMLRTIDAAAMTYELVCYARGRDWTVGPANCAPAGHSMAWVQGTWLFSHFLTARDERLLADIARRLRGLPPLLPQTAPPPR